MCVFEAIVTVLTFARSARIIRAEPRADPSMDAGSRAAAASAGTHSNGRRRTLYYVIAEQGVLYFGCVCWSRLTAREPIAKRIHSHVRRLVTMLTVGAVVLNFVGAVPAPPSAYMC